MVPCEPVHEYIVTKWEKHIFVFVLHYITCWVTLSCWVIVLLTMLTHWCRVTHICVSDLTSIGSDNGLSPGRRQAIIRTNAGILLIRPLGTNFSVFSVEILISSFKKTRFKVSSAKRRPFCLGLNELTSETWWTHVTAVKMLGPISQVQISTLSKSYENAFPANHISDYLIRSHVFTCDCRSTVVAYENMLHGLNVIIRIHCWCLDAVSIWM